MSWLRKLLGGGTKPDAGEKPGASSNASGGRAAEPMAPEGEPDIDPAFTATVERRDTYWAQVGSVENDLISYLISPQLMGGSAWPTTRQAFRVVRTPTSIILATDGLSDPFDDADGGPNGFEVELFIETADIPPAHAGRPGDVDPLKASWAFPLLENIAAVVADAGGIVPHLDKFGVVSVESPGVDREERVSGQLPKAFITDDSSVGFLLGLRLEGRHDRIADAPLSPIRLVALTLLTAAELEQIRAGDASVRREIAAKLAASPTGHFSDLRRASVV